MTRRLPLEEILEIHQRIIKQSGGTTGIRDLDALQSAISQPFQSFGGTAHFPTDIEKAAAYAFYTVNDHPFVDGNKRTAHATMEVFLNLNGKTLEADVDTQESIILDLASGDLSRYELTEWLNNHVSDH